MTTRLFGPRDAGLTSAAEKMIDFFRLRHLADELASSLSYGQQKLLDAAMAFMSGPRLVLLDEPAGGVNLTMLESLRERLRAINAEQRATFICDRAQYGIRHGLVHAHRGAGGRPHHRARRPGERTRRQESDRGLSWTLIDPDTERRLCRLRQDDNSARHEFHGAAQRHHHRDRPERRRENRPRSRPFSAWCAPMRPHHIRGRRYHQSAAARADRARDRLCAAGPQYLPAALRAP